MCFSYRHTLKSFSNGNRLGMLASGSAEGKWAHTGSRVWLFQVMENGQMACCKCNTIWDTCTAICYVHYIRSFIYLLHVFLLYILLLNPFHPLYHRCVFQGQYKNVYYDTVYKLIAIFQSHSKCVWKIYLLNNAQLEQFYFDGDFLTWLPNSSDLDMWRGSTTTMKPFPITNAYCLCKYLAVRILQICNSDNNQISVYWTQRLYLGLLCI